MESNIEQTEGRGVRINDVELSEKIPSKKDYLSAEDKEKIKILQDTIGKLSENKNILKKRLSMTTTRAKNTAVRQRLSEARNLLKGKISKMESDIEIVQTEIDTIKAEAKQKYEDDLLKAIKPDGGSESESESESEEEPKKEYAKNLGANLIKSVSIDMKTESREWKCKKCGHFSGTKADKPKPLVCHNDYFIPDPADENRDINVSCDGRQFVRDVKHERVQDNISSEYLQLWDELRSKGDKDEGYKGLVGQ